LFIHIFATVKHGCFVNLSIAGVEKRNETTKTKQNENISETKRNGRKLQNQETKRNGKPQETKRNDIILKQKNLGA
jgi:hypothetical protein